MSSFEELGIVLKSGQSRFYTVCPQCDKTRKNKGRPSLTVNNVSDNRWFKCWNCGWSGNVDVQDKYKEVAEKSRMPKEIQKTYSMEVRNYFKSRGIDSSTALREKIFEYNIGSKPILGFPFYMNMTLVNVKYRDVRWKKGDVGPKFWQMNQDLGTRSIFWGLQSIKFEDNKNKTVIITEGEIDTLTWKQCGYNNAVSVPMGAPSPKAKTFNKEFDYAKDIYVQSLFDRESVDLIVFSTDNDEPGRFLRDHLTHFFGKDRCKYINYPVGYKDINEVYFGDKDKELPALGQEGVDECFQNLSSFPVKGVIRPSDVRDDLKTYAEKGFTPGLGIGKIYVDRLFTLKPKHITFVSGVPGCFAGNQLIHTNKGISPISEIKGGEMVLSYDHLHKINEYRKVIETHHYKKRKDKLYKIKLRDGTIIKVTEDHLFFTGGEYVKVKDILKRISKKSNSSL